MALVEEAAVATVVAEVDGTMTFVYVLNVFCVVGIVIDGETVEVVGGESVLMEASTRSS